MATEFQLLQDLAVVMGAAALTAILFRPLRLPLVFGFLVAGVIIGPHTPPFQLVRDEASIQTLATLGVVLLLFGLGLDFNFRHLRRVGVVAFVVMTTEVLLMFWAGFELGQFLGWTWLDSIFLGAMISISSSAIIVKVLREAGRLNDESSRIIFGVLVLEDVAAVIMLVVLGGYGTAGSPELGEVLLVVARMALFLLGTILLGVLIVPRIVDYIAVRHGSELLILTLIGLAFGFAVLSSLAELHPGLGAFLMGAVVAEARERPLIEAQLRPVHDVFAAIFFVSIGMLVDFAILQAYWKPILAIFLIIVVGKVFSGAIATFLIGYAPSTAFTVGIALAQMGEFSFVIASLGLTTGVTSDFLFPVIVGAAALTSLSAPLMIRSSDRIVSGLGRLAPQPLRTYGQLYYRWMTSIRSKPGLAQQTRRVRARRSLVVSLLLSLLTLGAAWLLNERGRAFLREQGMGEPGVTLTYWGVFAAALLPLLFVLFQSVNRWAATWEPAEAAGRRTGFGFRHVVQMSFYLLGIILLGLPVLAATAPILRTPFIALAWVAMVLSAAVILWASIVRLHSRVETTMGSLFDEDHPAPTAPRIVRDLMLAEFPAEIRAESLDVHSNMFAAGKRLDELELRSATGASVILIERGEERRTPGPTTAILPGDRITLIGTRDQLAGARGVLARTVPTGRRGGELRLGRLYVSDSSALDGARLADAALPQRSGLQVMAIIRDERTIPNPGAQEVLRPGDVIVVLGAQEQITAALDLAAPGDARTSAAPSTADV